MDNQTVAASSPAEVEDVFRGEQVSLDEFSKYRQDGELPARFKPADPAESAPADPPEETAAEDESPEPEPDSEPEEIQEPPKGSAAEKRIKQLLAKVKELESKQVEKPDGKTESSPAQPQTRTEPTLEDKKPDGTPKYDTYEKYVKDLARWEAEQMLAERDRQQAQREAQKALQGKLDEARTRYDDADTVIFPAANAIQDAQIPVVVKEVFAQSDVYIDLCYVVGSDPEELKKFVSLAQTNPRAAISKVFEYERGIQAELKEPERTPERKTAAPKPPTPVGGGSSRAFDVSDESLSADEWARKRTADLKKRGKG